MVSLVGRHRILLSATVMAFAVLAMVSVVLVDDAQGQISAGPPPTCSTGAVGGSVNNNLHVLNMEGHTVTVRASIHRTEVKQTLISQQFDIPSQRSITLSSGYGFSGPIRGNVQILKGASNFDKIVTTFDVGRSGGFGPREIEALLEHCHVIPSS